MFFLVLLFFMSCLIALYMAMYFFLKKKNVEKELGKTQRHIRVLASHLEMSSKELAQLRKKLDEQSESLSVVGSSFCHVGKALEKSTYAAYSIDLAYVGHVLKQPTSRRKLEFSRDNANLKSILARNGVCLGKTRPREIDLMIAGEKIIQKVMLLWSYAD